MRGSSARLTLLFGFAGAVASAAAGAACTRLLGDFKVVADASVDAMAGDDGGGCVAGDPCLSSACIAGSLECPTTGPVCKQPPAGFGLARDGTPCGDAAVCNGGQCEGCPAGQDCHTPGTCQAATVVCKTGSPVCTPMGSAPDGTRCGDGGEFCNDGGCLPCMNGGPCIPQPCHVGTLSCGGDAGPSCSDDGLASDGTNCGNNMVCFDGGCNFCQPDQQCDDSGAPVYNDCQYLATACGSGQSQCCPHIVPNGTQCTIGCTGSSSGVAGSSSGSSSGVTSSSGGTSGPCVCEVGQCRTCLPGMGCVPANPCHVGVINNCPTCTDMGTNAPAGISCTLEGGVGGTCDDAGTCVPGGSSGGGCAGGPAL